jgi:hypothetical protein
MVAWLSKKQTSTSLSIAKEEYIVMHLAAHKSLDEVNIRRLTNKI